MSSIRARAEKRECASARRLEGAARHGIPPIARGLQLRDRVQLQETQLRDPKHNIRDLPEAVQGARDAQAPRRASGVRGRRYRTALHLRTHGLEQVDQLQLPDRVHC